MNLLTYFRTTASQLLSVFRLAPFDTATIPGRSKERLRRAALATVTSLSARIITLLVSLISVPLTLHYLGVERYGLWMTISSVIALLGFVDLGIGNGVVNVISEANGKDDRNIAQQAVSSGFFMLLGIGLLIVGLFFTAYSFIQWPRVFNVTTEQASREAGPAMAVFVICFAANLPLGMVTRVQLGYQEGFINGIWQVVGSLLSLCGVIIIISLKAGLPWLVFALGGMPVVAAGINWLYQFGRVRSWLRPKITSFNWREGRSIAASGLWFTLISVMALIGTASDNIIIAQSLGASAVASYAVAQRLYYSTVFAQQVAGFFWPTFGEALARGDYSWVRKTLNRLLVVCVGLGSIVAIFLLVFGQLIIRIWAGAEVVPPIMVLAGFSGWMILNSYGSAITPFLNSRADLLRGQAVYYSGASILALILKIVFVPLWQGTGVIWATVIGYSILFVVPSFLQARTALNVAVVKVE